MRRDDALRILAANRAAYAEFGVRSLAIFGSVARDEARDDSDIDILVDYEPEARRSLFRLFALRQRLEEILGVNVDLVTVGGLRRELRDRVLAEAIRAA
jgi:predicted nucleotidyltransferase